ncbi:hypothetical protein O3P69_008361 [Scylla paramamosain]|uniref:TM7S3/TM198-like domain-containing protein n=1 Tax=Scylla paramamosain TaxID=85552 RepID=A0AAW0SJ88_SCYPA
MMKHQGRTLFCAWSAYLMCACASWSGVKTRENNVSTGSVPVLAATGQNNSLAAEGGVHLKHTISLDHLVSPNSILSTEAFGLNTSNNNLLENEKQSSSESSSLYVSPTTEALPGASLQTVLSQDVTGVTEYSRSLDGEETLQHNESQTSNAGVSANSVLSIQSSHESISKNSDSENEEQGVTESTPFTGNQSIETTPYITTPLDVTTAQNDKKRDNGQTVHEHPRSVCDNTDGVVLQEEEYSLLNNTHKITVIQNHTTVSVKITDFDESARFLIFQAHSQNHYLILSDQMMPSENCYTNSTDPGLVVWPDLTCSTTACHVFITNCHNTNITVLFMVQNYTSLDPIPGKYKAPCVAMPFLNMDPNILTTKVSYQAAAMASWESDKVVGSLRYEVFLTYMYERDQSESKYWDTLIATSTLQGLRENGRSVDIRENNDTAAQLNVWLVSYSGVGAVVTVVVSYNGSNGTLYSSGVSYGCNFIDAEKYSCTKLVTSLAKLFCASLLFIGAILLFFGHRWLNFTMFISGFFFSWCMLFLMFAQDTHTTINGLGWGTLVGAVIGGALWLVGWHMFQRPFHSSLLIIVMAVLFVGMMVTYFLRFAISPKTSNLSAFVVFPVFFAIVIIAYSIIDIKKVHIFSCTLLGSYAFIVPFAFYFGSSLTYIVINVLGLVTVQDYPETVGYPPFQVCDIILLCLWVVLFTGGMAYQLYRERASPPFHPPNLTSWNDFKKSANFVLDKMFICLPMDPDPGGMDIEERPAWMLRVVYTSKLIWWRLTCKGGDIPESGYESFPRIRRLSQYNEQDSETNESRMAMILSRIREWKGRVRHYFRRGDERLLQESEDEEQQREGEEEREEDESQLLEGSVSCCAFRNSQVVLDDAYTTNT